jgi:ATPase subunit of ABC transporter with duplicated ATPase domains
MTLKFQETLKELSISVACLLDEPTNILVKDIEHIQDLVTEIENVQGNN